MASCDACGDSRHVQTPQGWVRCPCLGKILDATFIKAAIRGSLTEVPAAAATQPPYPMADLTVGGHRDTLAAFKARVWRSLSHYRDSGLRYDYMEAARLVDIYFNRDEEYPNGLRRVIQLPLLVLVLGLADIPNKFQGPTLVQVLTLRRESGLPTWVFAPFDANSVRSLYGSDVADLVGVVRPVMVDMPGQAPRVLPPREPAPAKPVTVEAPPKRSGGRKTTSAFAPKQRPQP